MVNYDLKKELVKPNDIQLEYIAKEEQLQRALSLSSTGASQVSSLAPQNSPAMTGQQNINIHQSQFAQLSQLSQIPQQHQQEERFPLIDSVVCLLSFGNMKEGIMLYH